MEIALLTLGGMALRAACDLPPERKPGRSIRAAA
jgi:hypothetical protein